VQRLRGEAADRLGGEGDTSGRETDTVAEEYVRHYPYYSSHAGGHGGRSFYAFYTYRNIGVYIYLSIAEQANSRNSVRHVRPACSPCNRGGLWGGRSCNWCVRQVSAASAMRARLSTSARSRAPEAAVLLAAGARRASVSGLCPSGPLRGLARRERR